MTNEEYEFRDNYHLQISKQIRRDSIKLLGEKGEHRPWKSSH